MSAKRILSVVLIMSAVVLAAGIGPQDEVSAHALPSVQVPKADGLTVPYPGRLSGEGGQPVADGAYTFTFALYGAKSGGEPLWSEVQGGVTVQAGAFSVLLGSANAIPKEVLDGQERWLEVGVRGPGEADFTALTPRQRLSGASPWSAASPSAGPACPHDHWGGSWSGSGTGLQLTNQAGGQASLLFATFAGVIGVYGNADVGVSANSSTGHGLVATGNDLSGPASGDVFLGGNLGEIVAGQELDLYSGNNTMVFLDTNNDSNDSFVVAKYGGMLPSMTVDEAGNFWVLGNLGAGGTKSAIVSTSSFGPHKLYAVESPEVWFEDVGAGSLVDGEATVAFEQIFAETVNLEEDYHVFLTPLCGEPVLLFVTAKTPAGLTVRGVTLDGRPSECAFDYRIVAKRLGYEGVRLEPFAMSTSLDGD